MSVPGAGAAVVLAGGSSRRFGSDKLAAELSGRSLLDRAVEGLPPGLTVLVVGPPRPLSRPARFLREDPPGGGPAAAMVTGLREALAAGAPTVLVLPGDAPHAGHAAGQLLRELVDSGAAAVVATDATGFDQPLQLALTRKAALALVEAAGVEGAHGGSARALVNRLDPPARRVALATEAHFDVDTPEQLQAWQLRNGAAVDAILAAADALGPHGRPVVIALDGRSAAGKSTLASAIVLRRTATVVAGRDFCSPRLAGLDVGARERLTDAEVVELVSDWRRLREDALEPLVGGHSARFVRHDRKPGQGHSADPLELSPSGLVVVEGVYSGRPELADLVDLAVHVGVDPEVRRRRSRARVGSGHAEWVRFLERGEDYYYSQVRTPAEFDLNVSGGGS